MILSMLKSKTLLLLRSKTARHPDTLRSCVSDTASCRGSVDPQICALPKLELGQSPTTHAFTCTRAHKIQSLSPHVCFVWFFPCECTQLDDIQKNNVTGTLARRRRPADLIYIKAALACVDHAHLATESRQWRRRRRRRPSFLLFSDFFEK
jgi:hypothetical protein